MQWRGNSILRKLDPRRAESSEQLLAYDLADGEIKSTLIDANVIHDLNVVLKLNSIPLKRARKIAMDSAFDKLKKIKKLQNRTWTKTDIDKIINEYRTKFRDENNNLAYRAYCMAAIYVLENKKLHRP